MVAAPVKPDLLSEIKKLFQSLFMSVFWHILIITYGLLQLLIALIIVAATKLNMQDFLKDIIMSCSLLFFNTGLVLSVITDRFIFKKNEGIGGAAICSIMLLVTLILVCSITTYVLCFLKIPTLSYEDIGSFEVVILLCSLILTLGLKGWEYMRIAK